MKKVSLIIPTYNEAKNLPLFFEEVNNILDKDKIDLEYIVVDDNSPDGTWKVAEELSKRYPIKVIRRSGKLGLGSAVREGFKMSDREILGVMDADLSHNPTILNELIFSLDKNDVSIGSRFEKGSKVEDWKFFRKLISKVGVWFTTKITRAKDPLSGYFFFKKEVIENIKLTTTGYKILFEILVKGSIKSIKELPFVFRIRKFSTSKLSRKEYFLFINQIIFYSLFKIKKNILSNKLLYPIFLFGIFLLFFKISARTLWMDEMAVLYYMHFSPIEFLIHYFQTPDNHPPIYYLFVIIFYSFFPLKEFGIRFISACSGVGVFIMVYYYSLLLFKNRKIAYLALFFTAFSSYFILISQMARYHSLSAFFTLLALYFFTKLYLNKRGSSDFKLFILFTILVGWTDYVHFFYLIFIINLFYFYKLFKKKEFLSFFKWVKGQIIVFVSFLPMLWLIYDRIVNQGDGGFEKVSLLGKSLIVLPLRFLIHIYAYFFGENILPWNKSVFFVLGALVLIYLLIIYLQKIIRKQYENNLYLLSYLSIGFILLNVIFLTFANPRYNFIVYPKYIFVAFPLFMMLLSYIIINIPRHFWKNLIITIIIIINFYGLLNFYQAKNYLNASYFNSFNSFDFVQENSLPRDKIFINGDVNIGTYEFYKDSYFINLEPIQNLEKFDEGRMWLFATASDDENINKPSSTKIPVGFEVLELYSSTPLDSNLKKYKEKVLGRESYLYKNSIFLLKLKK